MKIVFTGGGSGGHFYPIVAVAGQIHDLAAERNLLKPQLYYLSNHPYDERLLYEYDIEFKKVSAGKFRLYSSVFNFLGIFATIFGSLHALITLFSIYPDIIFSKGGYPSVPVLFAARLLRIPVMIHDSDAVPGRANLWAGKFADRIAISYPQAAEYFTRKDRIAFTGNPIRKEIATPAKRGAHEFLQLSPETPTILILGGSQGAQKINDVVLETLLSLVAKYQIVHQTGGKNHKMVETTAHVVLENSPYQARYKAFGYLNDVGMRMSVGAAALVISRAGSGSIFEIANWEKPAIIIPIPEDVSRDQTKNAYAYARTGAAIVIEEGNLTPHLLESEIDRLMQQPKLLEEMAENAKKFKQPDAARKIAEELLAVALSHEN